MQVFVIDENDALLPALLNAGADVLFYADEIQALRAVRHQKPDIVLLGYAWQGVQTPDFIHLLLEANSKMVVIVTGDDMGDDEICHCLLAGASGHQNRSQLPDYFEKMLHVLAKGEVWVSRRLVGRLLFLIRQNLDARVELA